MRRFPRSAKVSIRRVVFPAGIHEASDYVGRKSFDIAAREQADITARAQTVHWSTVVRPDQPGDKEQMTGNR